MNNAANTVYAANPQAASARDYAFWHAHGGVGLVWSNPNASDSVMIANALLQANFHLLLDLVAHFGLDRLKAEWAGLLNSYAQSPYPEEIAAIRRAEPIVTRSIRHIEEALI